MQKYAKKLRYQLIYTEYKFNGKTSDVLHYNHLTKETIAYEVQKLVTPEWIRHTSIKYDNLDVHWELIRLDNLSDDIYEMDRQIKELIC